MRGPGSHPLSDDRRERGPSGEDASPRVEPATPYRGGAGRQGRLPGLGFLPARQALAHALRRFTVENEGPDNSRSLVLFASPASLRRKDSRPRLRTVPSRVQGEANEVQTSRARPSPAAAIERAPARCAGARRADRASLCGAASLLLRQARARSQRARPGRSPQIAAQRAETKAQARSDRQGGRACGAMPLLRQARRAAVYRQGD